MAKAKRNRTKGRRFRVLVEPFDRINDAVAVSKRCVIINSSRAQIPAKEILIAHLTHYPVGHEFTILKEGEFTVGVLRELKKLGRLKELPAVKKLKGEKR